MSKAKYVYMIESGNVFYTSHPEYHRNAERLTQAEGKRLYREQCRQNLLKRIKPGQTIYTNVDKVSRSGMRREISAYIVEDGEISNITGDVAVVIESPYNIGVVCDGCGMDMAWNLVYSLGRNLWPEGTPEPHGTRNGIPDSDGGYALRKKNL